MTLIHTKYKKEALGGLVAAVVSLPVNIAFGIIAFAPLGPHYVGQGVLAGMFGCILGGLVAALFGGTPAMTTGPHGAPAIIFASIMSKLLATGAFDVSSASDVTRVLGLTFLSVFLGGTFQLLFGLFRLGSLVKYISFPVVVGILNGTAILMIVHQIKPILGLASTHLIWYDLPNIQPLTVLVALCAMGLMVYGPKITTLVPPPLLGALGGTLLYYICQNTIPDAALGNTIGVVPSRFPSFAMLMALPEVIWDGTFWRFSNIVLQGAFTLSVIGSINSLLTALTLQNVTGQRPHSNRELIGQGLGNMAAAIVAGLPGEGLVGRSMANYKSGGRTKGSGVFCSVFLLLLVALFGTTIRLIPQAAMSALVVVLGTRMIDPWTIQRIRHIRFARNKYQIHLWINLAINLLVTLTLLTTDIMLAVGLGVVASLAVFLRDMSRSVIRRIHTVATYRSKKQRPEYLAQTLTHHGHQIVVIELEGTLFFGATDRLVDVVETHIKNNTRYIILDVKRVNRIDTTGYKILDQLYNQCKNQHIVFSFSYVFEGSIFWQDMHEFGLLKDIDSAHFFIDTDRALEFFEDALLKKLGATQAVQDTFVLGDFCAEWGFDDTELTTLQPYFIQQTYAAGTPVFQQGDAGDALFVVIKGAADIVLQLSQAYREKRVATLTPGTVFGEMALLDGKPRSATVLAQEDLVCYKLTTDQFQVLQKTHPAIVIKILVAISQILATRLRETNNMISELED